jgi:hypothetical protein
MGLERLGRASAREAGGWRKTHRSKGGEEGNSQGTSGRAGSGLLPQLSASSSGKVFPELGKESGTLAGKKEERTGTATAWYITAGPSNRRWGTIRFHLGQGWPPGQL